MNTYNSKFLIFENAKVRKKEKRKQSPDIGNLFPHFTEYIYYAITFYRYLCHKIVLLNLA